METVPLLISRLETLKHIHDDAIHFASHLHKLQSQQEQIQHALQTNDTLLHHVQEQMQQNQIILEQNMRALDERIKLLNK